MALHEHFRDYTAEEIAEIKQKVCIKHKCPYLQKIHDYAGKSKMSANANICDYFCITGRIRECMPDDCTYWKDKDVKKKKTKKVLFK